MAGCHHQPPLYTTANWWNNLPHTTPPSIGHHNLRMAIWFVNSERSWLDAWAESHFRESARAEPARSKKEGYQSAACLVDILAAK